MKLLLFNLKKILYLQRQKKTMKSIFWLGKNDFLLHTLQK